MRTLASNEVEAVCGGNGVTDSEANVAIGRVVGEVWHVLSSAEVIGGMMFGPGGMIAGALIHSYRYH